MTLLKWSLMAGVACFVIAVGAWTAQGVFANPGRVTPPILAVKASLNTDGRIGTVVRFPVAGLPLAARLHIEFSERDNGAVFYREPNVIYQLQGGDAETVITLPARSKDTLWARLVFETPTTGAQTLGPWNSFVVQHK